MSDITQVSEWIKRSKDDMLIAKKLYSDFYPKQINVCCYECQQAAEKALKSYLIFNDVIYPRTHDLVKLCYSCIDLDQQFTDFIADCAILTPYATQGRYPNGIELDESEAKLAIEKAERILSLCVNLMDLGEKIST